MKATNNEKWVISVHEASHFVFARLIKKLNLGFPQPTYIEISLEPGWHAGGIDGSWVPENNTDNATSQLAALSKMPLKCKIAQLMFLFAGYASEAIIDSSRDSYRLEYITLPCPPCPSDIDKCQKIAGKIVGNTKVDTTRSYWRINKDSIDFLNPIRDTVIKVLSNAFVKDAILYSAESICNQSTIDGNRLKELGNLVDSILSEVNFEKYVRVHCND